MSTQEQIQAWKDKHGSVYKAIVSGKEYYFHTLTRPVYMSILVKQAIDPKTFDNDMEVFKACVLNEYDETELQKKAGITAVLAEKIMLASGFEMTDIQEV